MVAPYIGPLTTVNEEWGRALPSGFKPKIRLRTKVGYKSTRPYTSPTYYRLTDYRVGYSSPSESFYKDYSSPVSYSMVQVDWNNPAVAGAYNKAYSGFIQKIKGDTAELGAALAEYRKTADMVSDRALQLYRFARAVRRGRFGEANDLLRVPKGFRPKARNFGGAFLEYSFGWAPTVGDIYNSMKVLANGCPPVWVRSRASAPLVPISINTGSTPHRNTVSASGTIKVQLAACVTVSNPNLWLLNQLGLINPASVVWELTPWSFVYDYFGNIGDVINSWTDMLGLSLAGACRSWSCEAVSGEYQEYGYNDPSVWETPLGKVAYGHWQGQSFSSGRDSGAFPGPSLRFNAPKVSLRRASTSIALLLQQLKGK